MNWILPKGISQTIDWEQDRKALQQHSPNSKGKLAVI